MTKTERDEFDQLQDFQDYMNLVWKVYQESSPQVQRFCKYGGWIALQFWVIRAPLTMWMTGIFPQKMNLIIHTVPGYIIADFIAGLLLAIAGFAVSEYGIWGQGGVLSED